MTLNGAGPGTLPLSDGQYQVVGLNSLRDKAGNPLRSTALAPNGGVTSGIINIALPAGQETLVPNLTDPHGGKYTTASTADTVAADAEGDYVVAWTDDAIGHQGVWVKMYHQTTTLNQDSTRATNAVPMNEILVSPDPTATDIAVARDVDGDFVVTWSAWNSTTDWDVFAQRFNAAGDKINGVFRVNSTTANTQQHPAVAMDAQGSFVITWESLGQDGSGYGIYAQAYNAFGTPVGGIDEVQAIDFTGGFTGTFQLNWNDDNNSATPDKLTPPITFNGNSSAVVASMQAR